MRKLTHNLLPPPNSLAAAAALAEEAVVRVDAVEQLLLTQRQRGIRNHQPVLRAGQQYSALDGSGGGECPVRVQGGKDFRV